MSKNDKVVLSFADRTEIYDWERLSLVESFTDPLGSLTFSTHPRVNQVLKYKDLLRKGNPIRLSINGHNQGSWLIGSVTTTISKSNGVGFDVECQSVLQPAYEASVDLSINKSVAADAGIGDVVLDAMKHFGFTKILVNSDRNVKVRTGKALPGYPAPTFKVKALKEKDIEAKPGQTAYSFCSALFSRLGLVLRADVDGELLLQKPVFEGAPVGGVHEGSPAPDSDRCLGDIKIQESNIGQFSDIVVFGQAQDKKGKARANKPSARVIWKDAPELAGIPYTDVPTTELIALRAGSLPNEKFPQFAYHGEYSMPYKPKYIVHKESKDVDRCTNAAIVHMCSRAARAFIVTVTVEGLASRLGYIWDVDTLVRTRFDSLQHNEVMWCLTRGVQGDKNSGYLTTLTLIPNGSLQLGEIPI